MIVAKLNLAGLRGRETLIQIDGVLPQNRFRMFSQNSLVGGLEHFLFIHIIIGNNHPN